MRVRASEVRGVLSRDHLVYGGRQGLIAAARIRVDRCSAFGSDLVSQPTLVMIRLHIDKQALAQKRREVIHVRQFVNNREVGATHAISVEILGPSKFVYDPAHPLPRTGTYAWIETQAKIRCYTC